MKDPFVEKEVRENLGEKAVLKELKPDGIVNSSEEVITIWIVLFGELGCDPGWKK